MTELHALRLSRCGGRGFFDPIYSPPQKDHVSNRRAIYDRPRICRRRRVCTGDGSVFLLHGYTGSWGSMTQCRTERYISVMVLHLLSIVKRIQVPAWEREEASPPCRPFLRLLGRNIFPSRRGQQVFSPTKKILTGSLQKCIIL